MLHLRKSRLWTVCRITVVLALLMGSVEVPLQYCDAAAEERVETQSRAADDRPFNPKTSKYTTERLRGRIVWMAEALERRYSVRSVPEANDRVIALETDKGELHPIVEDARGRTFRLDKQLRDKNVELLVRRYQRSPMVQVIRVYAIKKDGIYQLDYWCDVCSISTHQLGPCDCCQQPNRLRERRADEK